MLYKVVHNTSTIHTLVTFNVALCGGSADMFFTLIRTGPVHVCPWVLSRPSFTKPPPFTGTTDLSLSPFSQVVNETSWFYMRVFLTICSINFVEFTVRNHVTEAYIVYVCTGFGYVICKQCDMEVGLYRDFAKQDWNHPVICWKTVLSTTFSVTLQNLGFTSYRCDFPAVCIDVDVIIK